MRPNRMRLAFLATPGSGPGSVRVLLRALDSLQHGQGSLTPGASPGTLGDLERRPFRPCRPRDVRSGHPVLERAHRPVERVTLDRLLARPPDQPDDLIVRQPHRRPGARLVVDALEHHRALEVVAPEAERDL